MADRDKALEDYKAGLSYKEIADKHNVSESTVKSWASRHWNNDKKIQAARRKAKKSQLKGKKSCNQKSEKKSQKDAPKPRGAPKGSVNADIRAYFNITFEVYFLHGIDCSKQPSFTDGI